MEQLKAKPKRKQGRPKKYLNPEAAYSWFDEDAYNEAVKQKGEWDKKFEETKIITGSHVETKEEFEKNLREEFPDLSKLDINQLYILKGLDKEAIDRAFGELRGVSKPPVDKDTYTVKIPAEKANSYSWYLSIAEAFNSIREAEEGQINVAMLPRITNNRIVLDTRSMKLIPNPYMFTKGIERA